MGFKHGLKFQCAGDCVREIDVSAIIVFPIIMYITTYLIIYLVIYLCA